MKNDNLIPFTERSETEVKALNSKGGKNSGKTRRAQRDIKRIVGAILDAKPDLDSEKMEELRKLGFMNGNKKVTVQQLMDAEIILKAISGDAKCAELIHKLMGDFTDNNVVVNVNTNEKLAEVEKYLYNEPVNLEDDDAE